MFSKDRDSFQLKQATTRKFKLAFNEKVNLSYAEFD